MTEPELVPELDWQIGPQTVVGSVGSQHQGGLHQLRTQQWPALLETQRQQQSKKGRQQCISPGVPGLVGECCLAVLIECIQHTKCLNI